MKFVALSFFTLGMFTYTLIPKDISIAQVRPINVTQTQLNAMDDSKYGCLTETQIKDTMLPIGEKITAKNVEVCK